MFGRTPKEFEIVPDETPAHLVFNGSVIVPFDVIEKAIKAYIKDIYKDTRVEVGAMHQQQECQPYSPYPSAKHKGDFNVSLQHALEVKNDDYSV